MKAISLWQPWASLIAVGAKPYETRSWAPPKALIGQRIAIHAAKKDVDQALAGVDVWTSRAMFDALKAGGERTPFRLLPRGVIVCTAVLASAHQVFQMKPPDVFGDYSAGRWVWHLILIERLDPPVPAVGRQGFFEAPEAMLAKPAESR